MEISERETKNPAADPRKMRRIIAEDPEWNLETVPPLVDSCIQHIIKHFHERPLLEELPEKYQRKVLEKLPTTLPLNISAGLIADEGYWERCCRSRWALCDVSSYDKNWRRMFFERHAAELVEHFVPEKSDKKEFEEKLKLCSEFVQRLQVKQLLPRPQGELLAPADEGDAGSDDLAHALANDHLDCGVLLKTLHNMKELSLMFGVENCGMNFEWGLFQFTVTDCKNLVNGLKATPTLHTLKVTSSKMGEEEGRVLVKGLLEHPGLAVLDLSHNKLKSRTGRALGKLLGMPACRLETLVLTNNEIGPDGGKSLGHSLKTNSTLLHLDLRLNRLSDEGVQPILKSLTTNSSLVSLNVGSNDFTEASAPALAEVYITPLAPDYCMACDRPGSTDKWDTEGVEYFLQQTWRVGRQVPTRRDGRKQHTHSL
ncbi:Dynein regulatory complex subunit 5 [Geodia barretti]|uniref:Dynein regulatory complex subunit 5 n=1 Tax=Geodia barretti TaxID=519541 RepID=A0AA35S0Y0_GEOBA|nr:Dynein regulatory complex subunit 5 [Geodia barretti]